ncbi:MAG: hypothetical protein QF486_06215 [Candidatus Woesearchaeota archaeon]|jgi:hypothetical protein|nr:hypothetical protein [Candidatus Woesearchaeota archaeon]MDP7199180.1 hypothetical protein [Candidatus Woesearchaeota archaeon]MDP7467557.1 hypothetical protein [Candidatus Woesearchaeota archaeon]MDP7647039.1 hypothetical protein [Candidatus Woesearchaeota archaeon]
MRSQASIRLILFVMIELIMVVMFSVAVSKTLKDVDDIYQERFLARDIALLIDSFADHPVVFLYGFYEYDNDAAVKAFNTEFKRAALGTGGGAALMTRNLVTRAAVFATYTASLAATAVAAPLEILAAWGIGRGYVATLGEDSSILQTFTIETGELVIVRKGTNAGEVYPYIQQKGFEAKGKSLLRFVYEPGQLRLDTLEEDKIVWNPYRKNCKPITSNIKKIALDGTADMETLLLNLEARLKQKNIQILSLLDEEDKESLLQDQDAYISVSASERPGLRILYTSPKACAVYNQLTDLYSRDVEGAALLEVHPAQFSATEGLSLKPGIEIQIGPPELFIDNPREVASAIAKAFP